MDRRVYSRSQTSPQPSIPAPTSSISAVPGSSKSPPLPSPSQLNLAPHRPNMASSASYTPRNTLPPLNHTHRYDPGGPYQTAPLHSLPPSHRQLSNQLHGMPMNMSDSLPQMNGSGQNPSWAPHHRTSNSRDDSYPSSSPSSSSARQDRNPPPVSRKSVKRERESMQPHLMTNVAPSHTSAPMTGHPSSASSQPPTPVTATSMKDDEDNMPSASDFVKKLYKMLEDDNYRDIVSWGPQGDCFVVKDMSEFTKFVLPRMFKHSNFASFVRQLNKYDFHKVKKQDDSYGDHSWIFKHPDFHADRIDALELIKRKIPPPRKQNQNNGTGNQSAAASAASTSASAASSASSVANGPNMSLVIKEMQHTINSLSTTVTNLQAQNSNMSKKMETLDTRYQQALRELSEMHKSFANQSQLQKGIIELIISHEQRWQSTPPSGPSSAAETRAANTAEISNLVSLLTKDSSVDLGDGQQTMPPNGVRTSEASSSIRQPHQSQTNAGSASAPPLSRQSQQTHLQQQSSTIHGSFRNDASANIFTTNGSFVGMNDVLINQNGSIPQDSQMLSQAAAATETEVQQARAARSRANSINRGAMPPPADPGNVPFVIRAENGWTGAVPQEVAAAAAAASAAAAQANAVPVFTGIRPMDTASSGTWAVFDLAGNGPIQIPIERPAPQSYVTDDNETVPASRPPVNDGPSQQQSSNPSQLSREDVVVALMGKKVLVVDDDSVSRAINSKILKKFGCISEVAFDGVEAVKRMELQQYDIVFMDIVMPKRDGVTAASMIRQFNRETPIISMTSDAGQHNRENYSRAGMNDILPKPFDQHAVLRILEKHLLPPQMPINFMGMSFALQDSLALAAGSEAMMQSNASIIPRIDEALLNDLSPGICRMIQQYATPHELDLGAGGVLMNPFGAASALPGDSLKRAREDGEVSSEKRPRFEEVQE